MAEEMCESGGAMSDVAKDSGAGDEVQDADASPPMFSIRLLADVSPCGGQPKLLLGGVRVASGRDLRRSLEERDSALQQVEKEWLVEYFDPDFQDYLPLSEDLSELRGQRAARLRTSFVGAEEPAWNQPAAPKALGTTHSRRLTLWDLVVSRSTSAFRNPINWLMPFDHHFAFKCCMFLHRSTDEIKEFLVTQLDQWILTMSLLLTVFYAGFAIAVDIKPSGTQQSLYLQVFTLNSVLGGFWSAQATVTSIVCRVCLSSVHANNFDLALVAARSLITLREVSICAVCYHCVLETVGLALLMAKDQPAGVAFLDSAMHAKAWACFMFFCSAYDIFLFVTYGGLCLYSGLLSMERCVPGLPLLTTDKHGNNEEVTHMLVKKTLEALHDKAHAGVVKERAAETVEVLRAFRGSRRGSLPQGPQTHRLTAEFTPCVG